MEIKKVFNGSALTVSLSGRLDAITALELEKDLKPSLDTVTDLTIDLADLDYISSAGLRFLLKIQKRVERHGSSRIRNIRDKVRVAFDMTGFSQFLKIADDDKKPT